MCEDFKKYKEELDRIRLTRDSKAALAGVEKPVKNLDHGPDALRYYVNTCVPKWRYGEEG